jgi:membrane protein implicated in regulation of membrane protease activity
LFFGGCLSFLKGKERDDVVLLWFAAAVVLVIAELATGPSIADDRLGCRRRCGCAAGLTSQCRRWPPLVAIVAIGRCAGAWQAGAASRTDPDVNLDIGQELEVPPGTIPRARVPYRGADWDRGAGTGRRAETGRYRIVEVRGATLIVARHYTPCLPHYPVVNFEGSRIYACLSARFFPLILIAAIVLIAKSVKIVPQQHAWVLERLGRYHATLTPGLTIVVPFIDRVAYKHILKEIRSMCRARSASPRTTRNCRWTACCTSR